MGLASTKWQKNGERGKKKKGEQHGCKLNADVARRADMQQLDNKFSVSAGKSMGFVYSQRKQMSDHMDTFNLLTVGFAVRVCSVLKVDVLFVTHFQVL